MNIVGTTSLFLACFVLFVESTENDKTLLDKIRQLITKEEGDVVAIESTHRGRRFIPFAHSTLRAASDLNNDTESPFPPEEESCPSSADDFPTFLSEDALRQGGVILCILIGAYCFTLLAIVCDSYFLPTVERLCVVFDLSPDVAAATFMSIATSCPELFTNIIGTFITESDMGIGTVVGSSLFNALGVASIGGLAAIQAIQLDWWPVTRDVAMYIVSVSLLVVITWDDIIWWYEALILFIVYFAYFAVVFQNKRMAAFVRRKLNRNKVEDISQKGKLSSKSPEHFMENNLNNLKLEPCKEDPKHIRVSVISAYGSYIGERPTYDLEDKEVYREIQEEKQREEKSFSIFRIPEGSIWRKIFFFYSWPIKFCLRLTVPNPHEYPKLYPISFIMCILWIGSNSYVISWMISYIGHVFEIPDAVLGLTFLAAGGCLPESISITIMSRRGEGSMGVSNSLGANTMNILLSLGMPWFFKTISKGTGQNAFIKLQSGSIEYTILALVVAALLLYGILYLNKFRLSKAMGLILLMVYIVFIVMAILSEMVFFPGECS